jgi:hypothetical protein
MRLYIGVIGRYQKAARLPLVIARNGSCRKKSPPNVTEWVFTDNELSKFVRGQPQGLSDEEIRSALKYFFELDEYLRTRTVEHVHVIERIRNIRADLHGLADTYVSRIPGNLANERLLQWFIDYTTNARVEGMNKILRQNASTFSIANEKQHLINLGYPVWLADIAARYQDFKNNWRWIGEGSRRPTTKNSAKTFGPTGPKADCKTPRRWAATIGY